MWLRSAALGLSILAAPAPASAQGLLEDQFNRKDWDIWCPCRIDDADIKINADRAVPGNSFAAITVAPISLGGNKCSQEERDFWKSCRPTPSAVAFGVPSALALPESLGISLVQRAANVSMFGKTMMLNPAHAKKLAEELAAQERPGGYYCTDKIRKAGESKNQEARDGPCNQRDESEVYVGFPHRMADPLDYSFRFRMPATVEDKQHSVRWITAQWKQTSISDDYLKKMGKKYAATWGPSPFLAQRFDDGYLNITVQDEQCQCLVAAEKDFPGRPKWIDGAPAKCEYTDPRQPKHKECPNHLKVKYGGQPNLSTPRGQWVNMTYRVQGGRNGSPKIEVHQNGRLIVEVSGTIGYKPKKGEQNNVYFKIGQYRDYMPWTHTMDIDKVKIDKPGITSSGP